MNETPPNGDDWSEDEDAASTCSCWDEDLPLEMQQDAPAEIASDEAVSDLAREMGSLAPERRLAGTRPIVRIWNRLGGLMQRVAVEQQIESAAMLAVWSVESGPYVHAPGKAIIRFENHLLWNSWGKRNAALYDRYFRHGGRAGIEGKAWKNHQYREESETNFRALHTNQANEYAALMVATREAGQEIALRCISIGGPQILIKNHALLGYETAGAMYDAFQGSEEAHVRGFVAFCVGKDIIRYIQALDWVAFTRVYNGPGAVDKYSAHLVSAYEAAGVLLRGR